MFRKSSRKSAFVWLGVVSIVVQALMPVWQAYADVDDAQDNTTSFSSICFALTEAAERPAEDRLPSGQDNSKNHCLLCQLPSFGDSVTDAVAGLFDPAGCEAIKYLYVTADAGRTTIVWVSPPQRAPPV